MSIAARFSVVLLAAVAAAPACGPKSEPKKQASAPPASGPSASDRFSKDAEVFFDQYMTHAPNKASWLGFHQYDGKQTDVSAQGIATRVEWLRAQLATFEGVAAAELDELRAVELAAILTTIRGDLFELDVRRRPFIDPTYYPDFLELTNYISRDYAPLADRARAVAAICDGAPTFLDTAKANLAEAAMPRPWVDTALLQTEGLIEFVSEDVAAAMAGLEDGELAAKVSESLLHCGSGLATYRDFLKERRAKSNGEFALGPEKFLQMLSDKEGLSIDLARLEKLGREDLEKNAGTIELTARQLHPRKSIAAIINDVTQEKPAATQIFAEATAQTAAMRQLLIDKDLVSIPSDDVAEVRPSPPFMRWNFAFLSSPGPFEKKPLPAFYYISPPDPKWPRKEQKEYIPSRHDLLFTTVHEVWPGHFLQGLHEKRTPSRVLKSFCSYSFAEGWAHYAEEMMLEAGAGGDAKAAIGQLTNALLRNVRYVSAIGLHTKGMKVEESMALFQKRAWQDKASARQQAVRGTFDPGYLNYTLGKLMILKLRDDWKAKVGSAFTLKAFHDKFLSYGCAPIPAIRQAMLGRDSGPAL